MKTSLVYPAAQEHIDKYSAQEMFIAKETPEDYKNITLPFIESEQFSIQVGLSKRWSRWKLEKQFIMVLNNTYLILLVQALLFKTYKKCLSRH